MPSRRPPEHPDRPSRRRAVQAVGGLGVACLGSALWPTAAGGRTATPARAVGDPPEGAGPPGPSAGPVTRDASAPPEVPDVPDAAGAWWPAAAFWADLPRLMRTCQVPGLAVACLHQGELLGHRVLGLSRADALDPVGAHSLFEAASLSKPVLAWLALHLVDQGGLDLDEPLLRTLPPDDPGPAAGDGAAAVAGPSAQADAWLARVTARQVLAHTTGLPNWRKQPLQERLRPAFEPGSRVSYSGEAFFWLQRVMETRTGLSLDEWAERALFRPAGMRDSHFTWDPAIGVRSVHGHAAPAAGPLLPLPSQGFRARWTLAQPLADAWARPLRQWRWAEAQRAWTALGPRVPDAAVSWPGDLMANGAASLRCTAADFARFLRAVLGAPGAPRLAPARQALHTQAQVVTRPEWAAKTLGWNLEHTRAGPVLHHAGNNANVFRSFALAEPASGRALVVLTNGGGGATVYQHLVRAATGRDLLAFEP